MTKAVRGKDVARNVTLYDDLESYPYVTGDDVIWSGSGDDIVYGQRGNDAMYEIPFVAGWFLRLLCRGLLDALDVWTRVCGWVRLLVTLVVVVVVGGGGGGGVFLKKNFLG